MARDRQARHGHAPADARHEHRLACLQPRTGHEHPPCGEVREPKRRGLDRIGVADLEQVGDRSLEPRGVRARRVFADHGDVFARGPRTRHASLRLDDGCIEQDAPADPGRIDALANGLDDPAAIAAARERIDSVHTRQAASHPQVKVIQRAGLGPHDGLTGTDDGLCRIGDAGHIGSDRRTSTRGDDGLHGVRTLAPPC